MKYNELDLTKLIPNGLTLNESNKVERRNHINLWFLKAFEAWYKTIQDIAISMNSPMSLEACMNCTDDELNAFLDEYGAEISSTLTHEVKARFVHALATTRMGTADMLDAIVKFSFNNNNVEGSAFYEGCNPHEFKVLAEGDVISGDLTDTSAERLISNLDKYNLVTEKLKGISVIQDETTSNFVSAAHNSVMNSYKAFAQQPIIVGQDTYVDMFFKDRRLRSDWWWCTWFRSGSIKNLFLPNAFASNLVKDGSAASIPSKDIEDAVIKGDNGTIVNMRDYPSAMFYLKTYQAKPECYTSGISEISITAGPQSALICLPAQNSTVLQVRRYDLPNGMYSISDMGFLKWNTSHALHALMVGKEVNFI